MIPTRGYCELQMYIRQHWIVYAKNKRGSVASATIAVQSYFSCWNKPFENYFLSRNALNCYLSGDVSQGIYSTKALLHEEFIVDIRLRIERHAFDKSNRQTFYCIAKGFVRRCDVTPYSSQLEALKAEPFLLGQTVWLRTTRVIRLPWLYPLTRIGDFLLHCVVHF